MVGEPRRVLAGFRELKGVPYHLTPRYKERMKLRKPDKILTSYYDLFEEKKESIKSAVYHLSDFKVHIYFGQEIFTFKKGSLYDRDARETWGPMWLKDFKDKLFNNNIHPLVASQILTAIDSSLPFYDITSINFGNARNIPDVKTFLKETSPSKIAILKNAGVIKINELRGYKREELRLEHLIQTAQLYKKSLPSKDAKEKISSYIKELRLRKEDLTNPRLPFMDEEGPA